MATEPDDDCCHCWQAGRDEQTEPAPQQLPAFSIDLPRPNLFGCIGFDVVDERHARIGKLQSLWTNATGAPVFVGVRTGWLFGKTHVVPADRLQVNEWNPTVRLLCPAQQLKNAPACDPDADLPSDIQRNVFLHYGLARLTVAQAPGRPVPRQANQR